jgi:hypothetical protein
MAASTPIFEEVGPEGPCDTEIVKPVVALNLKDPWLRGIFCEH